MRSRLALTASLLVLAVLGGGSFVTTAALGPRVEAPRLRAQSSSGTVRFKKKTVRRSIEQAAHNVEAYQQTPLYSRVPAYVKKVNVDIGDRVKADQVLVELSAPDLEAELKQQQAALAQAKKALVAAESNVRSATARVGEEEAGRRRAKAEIARTRSQYERLSKAGGRGVIDTESVAETRYAYEAAEAAGGEVEARVASARALRDESEARRGRAEADVDAAAAARDRASAYAGFLQIKAPFDGVVTQRGVDEGHFVQPAASQGKPLVTVHQVATMRVFVHLPELEGRWIDARTDQQGPRARVRGQALGGRVLSGRVTRAAFGLDPRTRTLRTEIDVDNKGHALRPGAFVVATIDVERAGVCALPASAVRQKEGEVWCFVREGGVARRKRLEIGLEGGGLVEVRKVEGAEPKGDEAVIANPGPSLKDGDAVN